MFTDIRKTFILTVSTCGVIRHHFMRCTPHQHFSTYSILMISCIIYELKLCCLCCDEFKLGRNSRAWLVRVCRSSFLTKTKENEKAWAGDLAALQTYVTSLNESHRDSTLMMSRRNQSFIEHFVWLGLS